MAAARRCYQRLQKLALALPEVEEGTSHGRPWFKVKKGKMFAAFLDDHHGDGRLAAWCRAAPGVQRALVDDDADVYFVPPYVGPSGWVGVQLDRCDWGAVEQLLRDGWMLAAPKRLVNAVLEDPPPPRKRRPR